MIHEIIISHQELKNALRDLSTNITTIYGIDIAFVVHKCRIDLLTAQRIINELALPNVGSSKSINIIYDNQRVYEITIDTYNGLKQKRMHNVYEENTKNNLINLWDLIETSMKYPDQQYKFMLFEGY